ncbi:archaeal proteasome endopeptidase complex subunit beta [Desulfurococcaceae archaeon MEX13E-LK6-19]|nr:archaeal proteasome endopeptidase complex subunit beta [Desulfurococcaceae archaeon MEX13E-LK6-19]
MADGGTTVGIKAVDGVVLASERRLSYNGYILSKNARKVHPITDHIGVAFVGLYGDTQMLVRIIKTEAKYYELEVGREIGVKSLAKILSNVLYSYKLFPYYAESIVGGIDERGPQIYVLDPVGSLIEDDYAATGSGGPIAIGVIESSYSKSISVLEAKELAKKAIEASIKRDAASGDGIDLLIITKEGYKFEEIVLKR